MVFTVARFSTIRLISNDVPSSREWYAKLFDRKPVESTVNFVSFAIAGVTLEIVAADDQNPSSPGGSIGYWMVDDLNAVIARVESLGGKLYRGPLNVAEVGRTIVQVQDPFGAVIGFEARWVRST